MLCEKQEKLIKSHIYPEWVYKALYPKGKIDNNNQLILVSTRRNYAKKSPIGIWDDNILCAKCDQYIGVTYDEPAKNYLLDAEPSKYKEIPGEEGGVYNLSDANPTILKNFILSILLRAVWSNREEYAHVKLENTTISSLKKIINNNSQTDLNEFSVFITRFMVGNLKYASKKYSQVPYITRISGTNYWIINLPNGYKIYTKIGSKIDESMQPFFLRANYPVYILEWEKFEDSNELEMLAPHLEKLKGKRSN